MRRQRSLRRGASAVEFALWMPLMLLLFGGVVDLSLYMNQTHTVARVAREAARHAASSTMSQLADSSSTTAIDASIESACEDHARRVLTDLGQTCDGCVIRCAWRTDTSAEAAELLDPEFIETLVSMRYRSVLNLLPFLSNADSSTTFTMMTQIQSTDPVP